MGLSGDPRIRALMPWARSVNRQLGFAGQWRECCFCERPFQPGERRTRLTGDSEPGVKPVPDAGTTETETQPTGRTSAPASEDLPRTGLPPAPFLQTRPDRRTTCTRPPRAPRRPRLAHVEKSPSRTERVYAVGRRRHAPRHGGCSTTGLLEPRSEFSMVIPFSNLGASRTPPRLGEHPRRGAGVY